MMKRYLGVKGNLRPPGIVGFNVAGEPGDYRLMRYALGSSLADASVHAEGLQGLMDIALHPSFAANKRIYLTYHKAIDASAGHSYTLRADNILARSGAATIAYSNMATLDLHTSNFDDSVADLDDGPGHLQTNDLAGSRRGWVVARGLQKVGAVYPRRTHLDEHFTVDKRDVGDFLPGELIG